MKPQLVREFGSRTRIEVWGGYGEIGGNCVVIRDGDRKIVFDNGIRFSVFKNYYAGAIEPAGPLEMQSIGAVPPLEVFEDADAVYISHFHLDHLGLLGALPPETKVKVPSLEVYQLIYETYHKSSTWLQYVPAKMTVDVERVEPGVEDRLGVSAFLVSHSSFPSMSFVYRGSEVTVFYSGDFRWRPLYPLSPTFRSSYDLVAGVDVAVIEGTNIGSENPSLMGPEEFYSILGNVLEQCRRLVVVSIDWSDLEAFLAIARLASNTYPRRRVVVGSRRLLDYLAVMADLRGELRGLELYYTADLERKGIPPLGWERIELEEVLRSPGEYLIIQDPVDLLEMLRKLRAWRDVDLSGSFVLLTDPEPKEAPAEVEESVMRRWLLGFGLLVARIRVSGHYSPVDAWEIAKSLRPKNVIPVHTRDPPLLSRIFASST